MTIREQGASEANTLLNFWQFNQSSPTRPLPGVALQLCRPLQFGPLTYQSIECVFISSNQSGLWSCLPRVTSQLGPVEDLCMKQFWSVFHDGFLENFTVVRSMFESFLAQRICSYVGEPESLWEGWKQKPRTQIKSSKKDSNKKNDPVRRNAMIFELLR